jgi:hypothetical protein
LDVADGFSIRPIELNIPALADGQNVGPFRSDDTSATKEAERIASPTEAPNPI